MMKLGFASTKCGSWYPLRDGVDRDLVPADLPDDRCQILGGGDDVNRGGGPGGATKSATAVTAPATSA